MESEKWNVAQREVLVERGTKASNDFFLKEANHMT